MLRPIPFTTCCYLLFISSLIRHSSDTLLKPQAHSFKIILYAQTHNNALIFFHFLTILASQTSTSARNEPLPLSYATHAYYYFPPSYVIIYLYIITLNLQGLIIGNIYAWTCAPEKSYTMGVFSSLCTSFLVHGAKLSL